MKISNKQIINLTVETQSGDVLGKIESFNLDTESQSVLEYNVKSSNLVVELVKSNLIVSRGQVIEINNKKMIVEDLNTVEERKLKKRKIKKKLPQSAVMKEK